MSAAKSKSLTLGRVSGAFGVRGWLKIQSYTDPPDNIVGYGVWTLRLGTLERDFAVETGQAHGPSVVAKLAGIDDRDRALDWRGAEVVVARERLPALPPGEYYWADLEGLEVRTPDGIVLGTVDHLLATGGNDVLVVTGERERLVPFVLGAVIKSVDREAGVVVADWSPDY